jgi:MerR family transcriptional regulator, copper efflux regulator
VTNEATPAGEERTTGAMHIGQVAARTELSLRSLRHWDEVGLVKPSGRTDGGFRLYTEADVERILLIRRMKPLGFTLEAMSAAMRDIETLRHHSASRAAKNAAHQRLTGIFDDAAERREKLVRQLAMADEFIELLGAELG